MGRFNSVDPYDGSYDPTNPQSLNRYGYVVNNPFEFIDPTGLVGSPPKKKEPILSNPVPGDPCYDLPGGCQGEDKEHRPGGGGAGFSGGGGEGGNGAPNNGRTTCAGYARISAVGGKQASAMGALYSAYPQQTGGSIRGGTFGTVAVQNGFLGLSTRQLRTYGTRISISPAFSSASVTQYGGPAGPWTVSDYGDANIQATQGVAFDLYRFPTVKAANKFGIENMPVTISFPTASGGSCPAGYTVVP